jgi:hypothetical protein
MQNLNHGLTVSEEAVEVVEDIPEEVLEGVSGAGIRRTISSATKLMIAIPDK